MSQGTGRQQFKTSQKFWSHNHSTSHMFVLLFFFTSISKVLLNSILQAIMSCQNSHALIIAVFHLSIIRIEISL